jgi:hypothetical protein
MTQRTKSILTWGAILAPFFLPLMGWAAVSYNGSLVHQTEYRANRSTDSLNARYDRREILDSISETNRAVREIRDCLRARGCR